VGPGEVIVVGGPQEAEPVGEHLEHALGVDQTVSLRLGLEDLEDEVLLAEARDALNSEVPRDRVQIGNRLLLQLGAVHTWAVAGGHHDLVLAGVHRGRQATIGSGTAREGSTGMARRWRCTHGRESLLWSAVWRGPSGDGESGGAPLSLPRYSTGPQWLSTCSAIPPGPIRAARRSAPAAGGPPPTRRAAPGPSG